MMEYKNSKLKWNQTLGICLSKTKKEKKQKKKKTKLIALPTITIQILWAISVRQYLNRFTIIISHSLYTTRISILIGKILSIILSIKLTLNTSFLCYGLQIFVFAFNCHFTAHLNLRTLRFKDFKYKQKKKKNNNNNNKRNKEKRIEHFVWLVNGIFISR